MTIEFSLPKTSEVALKIFNILGEEVATLLSASLLSGSHAVEWDASRFASGVYLYRLKAGDYIETRKMVLMVYFDDNCSLILKNGCLKIPPVK